MTRDSGKYMNSTLIVDDFVPKNNYHPILGFYVHQSRRKYFTILFSMVILAALLFSALTFAIVSARQTEVTGAITSTTIVEQEPAISNNCLGEVALTEAELRGEVRQVDDLIFWSGPMAGAKYACIRQEPSDSLIRYLPNGRGLEDSVFNYRIIATYRTTTAYDAIVAAGESKSTVIIFNSDGSIVYYERPRPKNVFIVFKGLNYQIEIFDPRPGASLKLATTPGAIVPLY